MGFLNLAVMTSGLVPESQIHRNRVNIWNCRQSPRRVKQVSRENDSGVGSNAIHQGHLSQVGLGFRFQILSLPTEGSF